MCAKTTSVLLGLMLCLPAFGQEASDDSAGGGNPLAGVNFKKGPCAGSLGGQAEIKVPSGYLFAEGPEAVKLLEMMENPTSGSELGILAPKNFDWFVVFEFDEVGYVKDDEKDKLDADAILKSIRQGTEEANKERKRRGWGTLELVGWEQKPGYNDRTKNLEWATRGRSKEGDSINYNTRLLGRHGVMSANLVTGPDELSKVTPIYKKLLEGFTYKSGSRYAEFKPGDKIAKYGLTALITGGAAAVALKTGLFQKLWKLGVVVLVGIGAAIKKLFGRRSE